MQDQLMPSTSQGLDRRGVSLELVPSFSRSSKTWENKRIVVIPFLFDPLFEFFIATSWLLDANTA